MHFASYFFILYEQRMKTKNCTQIQNKKQRSLCPITNTLDIIGDKWTLLIIRDMVFRGKTQFGEFLNANEAISTNILTDRLKKLEHHNIITKRAYQENPTRYEYELSGIGEALQPILFEMIKWGGKHIEGAYNPTEAEIKAAKKKSK